MADLYARVSGERLVNTTKPGNEVEPKMIGLEGGGYVVVWTDQNVTGNYESRGQVFDNSGNPVGGEFLVNSAASGNQFQPFVAALEGGGFVVSFTDSIGDGAGNTGIRLQMFDATGVKVGSEFSANATAAGNQTLSSVAGLPGGGFIAVWGDSNTTSGDVMVRIFNAAGVGGSEIQVNTFTTNTQSLGVAAALSNGNIVVTWQDVGGADGSGTSVRGRILDATGAAVTGEFAINTTSTQNQGNPSVTALKDGGFVATWVDYSLLGGDAAVNSVKAQVFDNTGAKVGGEILVNTYPHYIQEEPAVSALESGGFIITFTDRSGFGGDTQDSGSKAIKGQVFNADGTKDGIEFLVNTTTAQNQWQSHVTGLSNGGFAVAWVDASAVYDNTGYGIVNQVFAPSDGTISDIALSGTTVSETAPENSVVGVLSADGPITTVRDLTYTIVADSTGGAFGVKGDRLVVADNAKLDFENATSATITVLVDDGEGHSYQEVFTIGVSDVANEVRWHAGNDIEVNATRNADQSLQAMAALSGGGYVITWTDGSLTAGDATGQGIHGQRFDNSGAKVGGEFLVNTTTAGNQTASSIVGTADGGFLVVWQDSGVTPSAIRGQFYDASGAKVGGEIRIDDGTGAATIPEVTLLNSGNFLVAWQDAAGDTGTSGTNPLIGVRGQLIDATGAKVGSEFTLNTQMLGAQGDPAISTTATGFVAVWTDAQSSGVIRAQFFDNTGAFIGGEFQVNVNSGMNQLKPTATVLANGDVLFTWWDLSLVGGDNSNGGIKGRLYNSSGTALTGEFLMNTTITYDQDAPRVAALPGGGFMLVFEDRSEYMMGDIRAQQFDGSGNKVGAEFVVNYDTGWAQKVPTIVALSDGGLAVAWYDGKNIGSDDPNGWDIETRVLHNALSGGDPVANTDSLTAETGVAETFAPADLLGNDTHAFGTLAIVGVTSGTGGTAVLNPDGTVTFTSTAAFLGTATFSYTISDGEGGTATGQVDVDVTGPNTPPIEGANAGVTVGEGGTVTISAAALDYDDAEQADTAITYVVTSLATNGVLQLSGTTLGVSDTFTQDDIANGRVTYVHDGSETTSASFGFSVGDGRGGTVAGQSFAITVTPVDDTPVQSGMPSIVYTVEEGAALLNGGLAIDPPPSWISDADSATVTTTLSASDGAFAVTGSGTAVVTGDGTNSVTVTGSVADVNFAVYHASYTPALDVNGTRTVTITTSDGTSSASSTINVDISALPEPPQGADVAFVATEDSEYVLHASDFGFSDADGDALAWIQLTTTPLHGTIVDAGGYMVDVTGDGVPETLVGRHTLGAGDPIDLALLASGFIRYVPAADAWGVAADSFTYQVVDDGGVPFTPVTIDPTPNTVTVHIGGVNDVPTLTDLNTSLLLLENDAPTVLDADVSFGDLEDNFDGGSVTVTGVLAGDYVWIQDVGSNPGEIGLSGTDVTYGGTVIGTASSAPGSALTVTLNADATSVAVEALIENLTYQTTSDTPAASRDLTITVTDDFAESTSQTITVNVTAVNDAPVVTVPADGAIVGYEGLPIALTGMQAADGDGGNAIMTANLIMNHGSIHVSDSVPGGVTSVSGNDQDLVVVSFDGTLAQINATLSAPGAVTLNAGADYYGPVEVTLLISDNGASGLDPGGPLPNAEYQAVKFIVDVQPVNDAPALDLDFGAPGNDAVAAYAIGDTPVTLAPSAEFTDDNTSYDGATLTVEVTANGTAGDQLRINSIGTGLGEIAVSGNTISYEGTDVATFTGGTNGTPLVVTFNADACHCAIQTVMDNVNFQVTGSTPDTSQRTIAFELVDGGGTANGGADTASANVTVDISSEPTATIIAPDGVADGTEVLVNTTTADHQRSASAASLADGGYVVAWQSYAQDGSGWGIYAQRYDASGTAVGNETQVNTFTGDQQHSPSVAALTGGGYVVTWTSVGQDGSMEGIYAQRFDAAGDPAGSETRVNTGTAFNQSGSSVSALSDGGYVVTWQSSDADGFGVFSQRYNAAGVAQGSETQVNTTTAASQDAPSVAALAGGGYVVTWQSMGQDGDGYGIYARLFDGTGAALTGEMPVNTESNGEQSAPSVAALAGGGYIVTWQTAWPSGDGIDIAMQRYDAAGNAVDGETLVNTTRLDDQTAPSVAALAGGGFVVTWQSHNDDGSGYTVYSQNYDASGNAVGGETLVNVSADVTAPVAVGLPAGDHVVIWHEPFQDGSGDGVYAQHFADAYRAVEQIPLDLKGTIHVTDFDNTGDVTVTLTVGTGVLDIDTGTSGVDVTELFADEWQLIGTISEIESLLNDIGVGTITYTYEGDYPPPSDTLTISIYDGATTTTDTAEITIDAVNDAPEVDLDYFGPGNDATARWIEGDGPQLLAPDAYFDDDNDSHAGATLTVTINGATTGDQLTIDSVGTDIGELSVSGSDVLYEGEIVGSWSGGANGDPLVITFNADACYCSIELAMASILYENTDNISEASSRTVEFTFNDNGGTANGGVESTTSTVDLTVLPAAEIDAGPAASGSEDLPIPLSGVVIDGLADDPSSDVITVRLSVDHGTLALDTAVPGGVAAGDIVGNGTGFVVVTGTQDAINATLAAPGSLTYMGDPDFFGADTLAINAAGGVAGNTLEFTEIGGIPIPLPVAWIEMVDVDGDGSSDLVFGFSDTVIVYGSAVAILPLDEPGTPTGFAVGDFDGDGLNDVAFAVSGAGTGYIAYASGGDIIPLADLGSTFDIVAGDFNGDGLLDLAATDNDDGRIAIALQDPAGGFEPVSFTATTSRLVGTIAVGDFNGDNRVDLLVANVGDLPGPVQPGSVDLLLGNGDGTFQAAAERLSTPGALLEVITADFDGDGNLDFAVASSNSGGPGTNGVIVALGNGDGTFAAPVGYDTTLDGTPGQIVTADFDGDGVLDIAVANNDPSNTFSILVGNGDGSFQAAVDFDTYYPAFAIAVGDPDGDGDMDLVTGSVTGDGIELFNNDLDLAVRTAHGTKAITVAPLNDAPTVTNLAGDTVNWTEGSGAVLLDNAANAVVSDVDSADFDGGSLTLAITAGGDAAQDVLGIVNQGTGAGQIGVSGTDLTYEGVTIGTIAGGSAGAPLQVAFNASATTQAVEALTRAVTYANTGGGDPLPGTRTVGWTLVDGDGTAGGGADTLVFSTTVEVINGQPVVDLNGVAAGTSNAISYTEGDPLILIAPAATVIDPNTSTLAGGVLTVEFTANADPEDALALSLASGAFFIDEVDLYYNGTMIGSIAGGGGGGGALVFNFNADATLQAVEAIVQAVGYSNLWTSPGNLQREVTFTFTDGDGDTADPVVATVDVTEVFSPPYASNDDFSFVENDLSGGNLFVDNGYGEDANPDGGPLQVTQVNGNAALVGTTITLASGALLKVNANGTFSYDPHGAFSELVPQASGAVNYEVGDSFSYTITGGTTATVTITQNGIASVGDIYKGDAGVNVIFGLETDNLFHLQQGGNDEVFGGGGDDAFYFGAAFTAADTVDGGAGTNDQIGLEGDYTGANALVLGAGTITGVEVIAMLPGYGYDLTTVDANVASGGVLKVFAGNLGAGDSFTFDGSAETDGAFLVFGGKGTDVITTGAGDDGIYFGPGKFDPTVDRVDGGTGANDQLALDGHYALTLDGTAIQNIDVIALLKGIPSDLGTYDLTFDDTLVGAGETLTVWGSKVETALALDGSGETDGSFKMFGGTQADTLAGGAGDDWFWGGLGGDEITGGAGADTFFYDAVAQSKAFGYDTLVGFDDAVDKIQLDGLSVTSFAGAVSGTLDAVTMDSMLEIQFGGLAANQAAVFTATGGDLAGTTFLMIDANGTTGYQASGDFLIAIQAPATPIDNLGMFI